MFIFFFQAEDGIRFWSVTGVQTCALPICILALSATQPNLPAGWSGGNRIAIHGTLSSSDFGRAVSRSEERRVGKEGESGGAAEAGKKQTVVRTGTESLQSGRQCTSERRAM